MEGIVTALITAIGTFATSAMGAIASIVPVALPIMGALVVVSIGIKAFRKFAKQSRPFSVGCRACIPQVRQLPFQVTKEMIE